MEMKYNDYKLISKGDDHFVTKNRMLLGAIVAPDGQWGQPKYMVLGEGREIPEGEIHAVSEFMGAIQYPKEYQWLNQALPPTLPEGHRTYLDQFRDDPELPYSGITFQGCSHETTEDFYQNEILGHCGCGDPQQNLEYIYNGLEWLGRYRDDEDTTQFEDWPEEYSLQKPAGYFFWYVVDKAGLTEHGSSVPGWLTPLGKMFVHDIGVEISEETDTGESKGITQTFIDENPD